MADEYERMRSKSPAFLESVERQTLNENNVPIGLRRYIPYAEVWGVAHDLEREQLVQRAQKRRRPI